MEKKESKGRKKWKKEGKETTQETTYNTVRGKEMEEARLSGGIGRRRMIGQGVRTREREGGEARDPKRLPGPLLCSINLLPNYLLMNGADEWAKL